VDEPVHARSGGGGRAVSQSFILNGPPVAKQRPRRGPAGNWYTPTKTTEYEEAVAWAAKAADVHLEPQRHYAITIHFYVSTHRKDIDNMAKAVLDGLQRLGDGWNDRQVVALNVDVHTVRSGEEERVSVSIEDRGGKDALALVEEAKG
jgi:Holliday junction resolvase RusA-like endonuclease